MHFFPSFAIIYAQIDSGQLYLNASCYRQITKDTVFSGASPSAPIDYTNMAIPMELFSTPIAPDTKVVSIKETTSGGLVYYTTRSTGSPTTQIEISVNYWQYDNYQGNGSPIHIENQPIRTYTTAAGEGDIIKLIENENTEYDHNFEIPLVPVNIPTVTSHIGTTTNGQVGAFTLDGGGIRFDFCFSYNWRIFNRPYKSTKLFLHVGGVLVTNTGTTASPVYHYTMEPINGIGSESGQLGRQIPKYLTPDQGGVIWNSKSPLNHILISVNQL